MGLFDVDETKLKNFYYQAWIESGKGFVDPHKYPYLEQALVQYAKANGCTFDQALILAMSGKKLF